MTSKNPIPQPPAFNDRLDAAAQLADQLRPTIASNPPDDVVAVGLARGGVIIAAEVARLLGIRTEALVVRKIGAPTQPELAIGAVTASGDRVFNERLIHDFKLTQDDVEQLAERARLDGLNLAEELGVTPEIPTIAGKVVILCDDGLATGATMRVAIESAYRQGASRVIVAVPVAPTSVVKPFQEVSDGVVTVVATNRLSAVGQWYRSFGEVTSGSVRDILHGANPAHET